MTDFENPQLRLGELPQVAQLNYSGLEKTYLKVLFLNRLVMAVVLLIIVIAPVIWLPVDLPSVLSWIVIGATVLLALIILAITPAVFRVKAYGIRQRDIVYLNGLIFRVTTVIPFNRVQHAEIKNGPVDRLFGLARLKIYTAGGSQSDMTIPGLTLETAEKIKDLIIKKTAIDEEE